MRRNQGSGGAAGRRASHVRTIVGCERLPLRDIVIPFLPLRAPLRRTSPTIGTRREGGRRSCLALRRRPRVVYPCLRGRELPSARTRTARRQDVRASRPTQDVPDLPPPNSSRFCVAPLCVAAGPRLTSGEPSRQDSSRNCHQESKLAPSEQAPARVEHPRRAQLQDHTFSHRILASPILSTLQGRQMGLECCRWSAPRKGVFSRNGRQDNSLHVMIWHPTFYRQRKAEIRQQPG